MRTIYLVRHCEYENPDNIFPGRLPVPLSETGFDRAEKLHEYFKDKYISQIFSSPVLRCRQTAETISKGTIPVLFDLRIAETMSAYQGYKVQGDLRDDKSWEDYHSHVQELGGETFVDIQTRMKDFYSYIHDQTKGNVIICSHQDPLYVLYLELRSLSLQQENIKNLTYMEANGAQSKGSVYPVQLKDDGTVHIDKLVEMTL